ncbi:MAG: N-acetylmuramoyl-L-alanine amidase, partial [Ornithinimicrobium sp.]
MSFRHAFTTSLVLISFIFSSNAPAIAVDADGDEKSTPSSSRVAEVTLDQQDSSAVWKANLQTQPGVNIIGLTWDQGEMDESEHEDGADTHGHSDAVPTPRMRTRVLGGAWGDWRDLAANETEASTGTEGDLIVGVVEVQLELDARDIELLGDPKVTTWNEETQRADTDPALAFAADGAPIQSSGLTSQRAGQAEIAGEALRSTGTTGLAIATRAQWGADEAVRKWSPNHIDSQAGVTIHHTAGSNSYTADQVPAILRGIYRYHAVTRDWGDVGYNVFVDKYGRAWEGRRGGPEAALRTAHALGMNRTTAGVSLLGDYSSTNVPRAAFDTVARVTAWKLGAHGNSSTGTFLHENTYEGWTRDLPKVHGHRDVNGTSCPGARFYARFGEFRSLVRQYEDEATAVQRVAGPNRYDTAAQIAADAHPF